MLFALDRAGAAVPQGASYVQLRARLVASPEASPLEGAPDRATDGAAAEAVIYLSAPLPVAQWLPHAAGFVR